jgi:peptide methionine sulfoxide reductase MsrA
MGLYIIRELVDEAGFDEPENEDEGNQFRMVIYRVDDEAENKPANSAPATNNGGETQ